MCSPRSVFPGVVAQSTSPRVATSIGACLSQILRSQYSSTLAHKQVRFKSQTAGSSRSYQGNSKISKTPQHMSRYLSSLLSRFDLQSCVTCTSNTPSHSSGLGFANTTPTGQAGRENSRAFGSMEENNLKPVGPSSSQWVQVGVHLTTTTVPQTDDCAVRAQGSSHLRQDREDDRQSRR